MELFGPPFSRGPPSAWRGREPPPRWRPAASSPPPQFRCPPRQDPFPVAGSSVLRPEAKFFLTGKDCAGRQLGSAVNQARDWAGPTLPLLSVPEARGTGGAPESGLLPLLCKHPPCDAPPPPLFPAPPPSRRGHQRWGGTSDGEPAARQKLESPLSFLLVAWNGYDGQSAGDPAWHRTGVPHHSTPP